MQPHAVDKDGILMMRDGGVSVGRYVPMYYMYLMHGPGWHAIFRSCFTGSFSDYVAVQAAVGTWLKPVAQLLSHYLPRYRYIAISRYPGRVVTTNLARTLKLTSET